MVDAGNRAGNAAGPRPRRTKTSTRLARQRVLIEFGSHAIVTDDLHALLRRASASAAEGLDVGKAKVMRYRPYADDLLVVAGTGWKEGVIGETRLPADMTSPAGRALRTARSVSIPDLRRQSEFRPAPLLAEHGVVSLLNVPIRTNGTVWGVIEVDGTEPHRFGEDAALFLRGLANLLGAAIRRLDSEANLRAVADLVPDILWRNDLLAHVDWYNRRWVEYTGRSIEESSGEGWLEAIHPEDREDSRMLFRQAVRRGGKLEREHRIRGADGSYRWFLVRIEPVRGEMGRILQYFGAATDIHDRRQAEKKLRESEELLRLALDGGRMGIWEWDLRTRRIRGDAACRALFDLPPGDGADPAEMFLDRMSPEGAARWEGIMATAPAPGQEFEGELQLDHVPGRRRWIAWRGRARRDAPSRIIGVSFDITAAKHIEKALHKVRDEALAARAAAEEANRGKSRFLSSVSHDLRQPVMAANLFLNLLRRRDLGPEGRDLVDSLVKTLDGLAGMLNNLLEVARLEAGIGEASIRDFPLDDLLQRLQGEFQGLAQEAGLYLYIAPAPWCVRSDPVLVEMILRNLISNALKFTEKGGVAVEAHKEKGSIVLSVTDTGMGIMGENLGRIFDDYFQAGDAARGHPRGFGIGLATVRRVAGLLGTEVGVRSETGRGSTFAFTLPLVRTTPPRRPKAPPPGTGALAGRSVLVVEDDPLVLKGLELMLRSQEMRVHTARDLKQVDDLLARMDDAPDIVLADYTLARGELGTQAVARVRRRGPSAVAVLLTGDTSPERLAEADRSGCHLLHKPIDPEALKALLMRLLAAS